MQKQILKKIIIGASLFVMSVQPAYGSLGSSANYKLDTAEVTNLSGAGSSANYAIPTSTLDGNIDGRASSASYKLCSGLVEEVAGGCRATVTPPTPPIPPPPTPPSGGGGSGGGWYIPPKTTVIEPIDHPVAPGDLPSDTYPTPGELPPVTPPVEEPATQPPATRPIAQKPVQTPAEHPAAGEEGEFINGRPIGVLPVIPGMGDLGYEDVPGTPSFTPPGLKENVWCGKASCYGMPYEYFKASALTRRTVAKTQWHAWFVLSLVLVIILLWVQFIIYEPVKLLRKRAKRTGRVLHAKRVMLAKSRRSLRANKRR